MAYIEFLRVLRTVRVVAIVIGVFLLIGLVFRIAMGNDPFKDFYHSSGVSLSLCQSGHCHSSTKKTYRHSQVLSTRTLANGWKQRVISGTSDHELIVITDRGYFGGHDIDILREFGGHPHQRSFGNGHLTQSIVTHSFSSDGYRFLVKHPEKFFHLSTAYPIPMGAFFLASFVFGLIIATTLGIAFGAQNEGHLELAFTRPAARELEAARAIAIDLAGIAAVEVLVAIMSWIAAAFWLFPHIGVSATDLEILAVSVLIPFAWYALTLAATASLRRGYGAVAGLLWPAAGLVLALAFLTLPNTSIWNLIHDAALQVSRIIPLTYVNDISVTPSSLGGPPASQNTLQHIAVLLGLTVAYSAAAIAQWRRVEA